MKFFIACSFLAVLAIGGIQAGIITQTELGIEWSNFIQLHSKNYATAEEAEFRQNVFAKNLELIKKHNEEFSKGMHTFTLGVNEFADWTNEEFRDRMTRPLNATSIDKSAPKRYTDNNVSGLPASVDYTQKGLVTRVKNQGQCSSCWAFSTIACLETVHAIKTGQLVEFSEQQLVDCTRQYGNQGCSGGWMDPGFKYAMDHGVTTERAYPYRAYDQQCHQAQNAIKISSFADITTGDERAMQSAVAKYGPVAIGLDSSTPKFQLYSSGVYSDPSCNRYRPNHALVVVGYGEQNGQAYWKVKNSWGTSWGNAGYILVARNKNNECGIADHASFPIY